MYGRPKRPIALPAFGGSDRVDARCKQAQQRSDTVYNHLPTHRGEHVTDKMTDGPDSVAFDEAKSFLRT
jgi:ornithine carbamoyltransferase